MSVSVCDVGGQWRAAANDKEMRFSDLAVKLISDTFGAIIKISRGIKDGIDRGHIVGK